MNETTRAWFYRGALAVITLASVYHLVDGEQAAAWAQLAAGLAGLGSAALATLNTTTKRSTIEE